METVHILNGLTSEFYRTQCASFSETRQSPWAGWARVLDSIDRMATHSGRKGDISVLDVGCGNLRFKTYLDEMRPGLVGSYFGIDSCDDHLPNDPSVVFHHADIVKALAYGSAERLFSANPPCDIVVAFGLMHHIPAADMRRRLVSNLVGRLAPGGIAALSFWRFAENEKLRAKAESTTAEALRQYPKVALEAGDYLLGWQNKHGVYRYCHSFSDEEIRVMLGIGEQNAPLVDIFDADGKSGDQNRYIVIGNGRF